MTELNPFAALLDGVPRYSIRLDVGTTSGASGEKFLSESDVLAALAAQEARIDTWRRNSRDTFDAMVAMRNSINEHVPMPSLESDLLQGPDDSVFCAAVAEAVVTALAAERAKVAKLVEALTRIAAEDARTNCRHGDPDQPFHVDGPLGKIARAALTEAGQ